MTEFKKNYINIKDSNDFKIRPQIREFPINKNINVDEFVPLQIKKNDLDQREQLRTSYLTTLNGEENDTGFRFHSLLKESEAIDEEEKRIIQLKVDEKIEQLKTIAWDEGHKKGYDDGFKEGMDHGLNEIKKDAEEKISQINNLFQTFKNAKKEILKENEKFYLHMLYQMGKMILLKELKTDPEYILRLSKALIEKMGLKENITLKVNPKDAKILRELDPDLVESWKRNRNLSIQISHEIELGGCTVESNWGNIDGKIESQLNGIYEALFSGKENKVIIEEIAKPNLSKELEDEIARHIEEEPDENSQLHSFKNADSIQQDIDQVFQNEKSENTKLDDGINGQEDNNSVTDAIEISEESEASGSTEEQKIENNLNDDETK